MANIFSYFVDDSGYPPDQNRLPVILGTLIRMRMIAGKSSFTTATMSHGRQPFDLSSHPLHRHRVIAAHLRERTKVRARVYESAEGDYELMF